MANDFNDFLSGECEGNVLVARRKSTWDLLYYPLNQVVCIELPLPKE